MGRITRRAPARRITVGARGPVVDGRADTLAVEEPLEIRVDDAAVTVTMRTPGDDFDLALGWLHAEGHIAAAAEAMARGGEAGAGMGAGLGMGMGMAMANQMAQSGPWGAAPAQAGSAPAAAPPPPPVEHVWHIARGGQTSGPFSKADMGKMASAGELTRET